jgi:hypothetical protein
LLVYGSECWRLTEQTVTKKAQPAGEIRFLRAITGYRMKDHKGNEDVSEELKMFLHIPTECFQTTKINDRST